MGKGSPWLLILDGGDLDEVNKAFKVSVLHTNFFLEFSFSIKHSCILWYQWKAKRSGGCFLPLIMFFHSVRPVMGVLNTRPENNQSLIASVSSLNGFIPSMSTKILLVENRKFEEIESKYQLDGIRSSNRHIFYRFDEHAQLSQLR